MAKWHELFGIDQMPSAEDIKQYIGQAELLWAELLSYLENTYQVQPKISYSKCPMQPGWNLKYQKSSKSLCTLYPMEGYFIALVVVGAKEQDEVEMALETFTPYIQKLYRNTSSSCGGRWLMIEVKEQAVLQDIKYLLATRVKPKKG